MSVDNVEAQRQGEGQSMVPLCTESGSTGTGDKAGQNGSVDCFLNTEGTVRAVKHKASCLWRDDTSEFRAFCQER